MNNPVMIIATTLFFLIAGYFIYAVIALRRATHSRKKDILWALSQLERAIEQIKSDDENEILAGLQTISTINHPTRLKILPKLAELSVNENSNIAQQAKIALEKIGGNLKPPESTEPPIARTA